MKKSLRVLVLALLHACSSSVDRGNPYDPEGTGVLKPGRIAGSVVVGGLPDASGLEVQVTDAAGVLVPGALVTDASGSFLSAEVAPGTYAVTVLVPLGNTPARWTEVKVLPGQTTRLPVVTSVPEPGTGFISGRVELAQTTLSPENVRVVAVRTGRLVRDTFATYTAPDGTYDFSELPPGTYELRADRTGFTPDIVQTVLQSPTRDLATPAVMRLYPASAVLMFEVDTGTAQVPGAPYTRSRNVDLLLLAFGASSGLSFEMRFSESPALVITDPTEGAVGEDVPWRQHLAKVPITLSAGEGGKTVHAQFRLVDAQGVEHLRTEVYSTSIVYDVTPPAVLSLVVAPDATVTGAGRFVTGDPVAVPVQVSATDALSRITGYRLVVEGASASSVPYVTVAASEATVSIADVVSLSSADGSKTVALQLVDGAGNESVAVTRTVIVDHTKPVVAVALNGGNAQTSNAAATLTITATDATSGVADYKVSSSLTCTGGTWQPFTGATGGGVLAAPFTLEGGDGATRSVSVQVRDGGGLVSDCATDDIVIDTVGPNSGRVAIQRGAAALLDGYTNDAHVTLDLFALGATSWQASTDPTALYYDNASLAPVAMAGAQVSTAFCLDGGVPPACTALPAATTATTTVFVRFYDSLGNGSEVAQASIITDNAAPSGGGLVVPAVGTAQVSGGMTYTRSPVLTVTPMVDLEAGLQMRLNVDGTFDAEPWVEYAATTSVVLVASSCPANVCTVQVQYRDRAGNTSGTSSAQVVLDTVAPVAPKVVKATDLVSSTSYTLQLVPGIVVDDNFLRFEVSGGADYASFTPVAGAMSATSFPVTLKPNQTNTVRVRAVDRAGNVSGDDFVLVTHDDTPPARPSGVTVEAYANTLRLRWAASVSPDVAFYRVYYGTVTKLYNGSAADQGISPVNVGLNTTVSLTGLSNGNRYYVAVSAVDMAANESTLSSELVGTPSVIAPRLLSQVGGPITGVWESSGGYVYVPTDGGLEVTRASGAHVDFLPALPDVTQVEFAPGLVFVHSSDPELGPVKNVAVQALFATLPNKDAPVRTLSIYSVDPTSGAHTFKKRQPLPDGTAFFLLTAGPGGEIIGTSATLGIEVPEGDVVKVAFYNSRLTYWTVNPVTLELVGRDVTIPPVIGWTVVQGRYLVLGEFVAGDWAPIDIFTTGTSMHVFDPFTAPDASAPTVRGVEIGSTSIGMANDGLVLPFGELARAGDVVLLSFAPDDKDTSDTITAVDFATPSAPVVWGRFSRCSNASNNPSQTCTGLGISTQQRFTPSFTMTATAGSAGTVTADLATIGPKGPFLQSPALLGHHLTFAGSGCAPRVIQSYTVTGTVAVFTFTTPFSGGCLAGGTRDVVQSGDTFDLELDATPGRPGIVLPKDIALLAADPGGHAFLATVAPTASSGFTRVVESSFTLTPRVSPFDMLTPTAGGQYDAPSAPLRLRVTSDAVLIARSAELEVRPRAGWDTASSVGRVSVDVDFHELHVDNGLVYAAVQSASGASRIVTIDASNPVLPKTVNRLPTSAPVKKLTGDGNRLYTLQGACDQGDGATPGCSCVWECQNNGDSRCATTSCWGNYNCNCAATGKLVTYTLAKQDKAVTDPFVAAPTSPAEVAPTVTVTVNHQYVDDLVPFWDQLLMFSHGLGTTDGVLVRAYGQQLDKQPGVEVPGSTITGVPALPHESFGLAVAGSYVFVPKARSAGSTEGDIQAYRLTGDTGFDLVGTVNPSSSSHWESCRRLEVAGDYLYAFTGNGLIIYDVSVVLAGAAPGSTLNINVVGSWSSNTTGGTIGGTVAGAYAYVMTRQDQGLVILDVSDPRFPTEAYRLDIRPMDVRVDRGLLYVTTQDSGLRIYELARPAAFRVGTRYPDGNAQIQLASRGRNRIFGVRTGNGVQLLAWPVTTPANQRATPLYSTGNATFTQQLPTGFMRAFGDQDVWLAGTYCDSCGPLVDALDTTWLVDDVGHTLLESRRHRATPAYANPDGAACTSTSECCAYQYCDGGSGTCKATAMRVTDLARGAATDTFAFVRAPMYGNGTQIPSGPANGIYVLERRKAADAPALPTTWPTYSAVAQGSGCSTLVYPEMQVVSSLLFSRGVLYAAGLGVVAMPAVNPKTTGPAPGFLDWATGAATKIDGPDHTMCARGLTVAGSYLYVLGDRVGDYTQACAPMSRNGNMVYHGGTHLWIYDITNPLNPVFRSELDFNHYEMANLEVSGNMAYFADANRQRVLIVDVSNRKAPVIAGAFSLPGQSWSGIDVFATDVFVIDGFTGYNAVDGR